MAEGSDPVTSDPEVILKGVAMQTETIRITPKMAEEMLANALGNRHMRQRAVDAYARDMRAGKWRVTGEAIKLDADGRLMDGQHRLWAILESGATVEMLVIRGIDPEAMAVMDTGVSRLHGDQLAIRKIASPNATSAIASRIWSWDAGRYLRGGSAKPTHSELDQTMAAEPLIEYFGALVALKSRRPPGVPGSVAGTAGVLFCRIDRMLGMEFWSRWADGASLVPGSPILTLRNLMTRLDRRLTPDERLAYACVAWNAWRDHRLLAKLQLPKGGLTNDIFPKPR